MPLAARCPICRRPDGAPCPECIELFEPLGAVEPPPGLDRLFAAVSYQDAARPLIAGLKYRNHRATVGWLADAMVAVVRFAERPDVVTWAPTTASRRRERGFDQAELLARAVSRRIRVPARRMLTRRVGPAQTGRSAAERRGTAPCFTTTRSAPPSVVLIDDVVTTGSTLGAAAMALRHHGACSVIGLVAGATPGSGRPATTVGPGSGLR